MLEEQAKKVPQGEKDNEKMEAVLLIPLLSSYSLDPSLVSNTRITVPCERNCLQKLIFEIVSNDVPSKKQLQFLYLCARTGGQQADPHVQE